MTIKSKIQIHKKGVFSSRLFVSGDQGILGSLYLPFFSSSGTYTGMKTYQFTCVNTWGNSFRIFRDGKSIGYIQMHVFRNLAQINLVDEGPYFFSTKGIFGLDWAVRKGLQSVELDGKLILSHQLEDGLKETLMACGLFLGEKVKKDFLIFLPSILFLWTLLFWIL